MVLLLALLSSCQGFSASGTPADGDQDGVAGIDPPEKVETVARRPTAVTLPGDQVIVRQCSAEQRRERSVGPSTTGYGGGGSRASSSAGATASAPPPPAAPAPTAAPASAPAGAAFNEGKSTDMIAGGALAQPKAAKPDATAATASTRSQGDAADKSVALGAKGKEDAKAPARDLRPAEEQVAAAEPADGRFASRTESKKAEMEAPVVADVAADDEAGMDWGATVYLSNDDSMSLASAQRLLWAVQKRGPVTASEVRPHEFLNYFSFDTEPVRPGDLFSVAGSARAIDGDTLTMAFAVKGAAPERKPLDLTMVLDRSGSMSAEGRMEYLKRGLTLMTEQLVRGDRVDLVLFDHEVCTPLENYVVGRDDPSILSDVIASLAPRGSTDLDAGLKEGYRIAAGHADVTGRNRRMMLISDALLNTGNVDPATVSEVGKQYEASGIRLTAVGVGRDFNDKVLDMLSEKGKGAYVYLGSEAVVDRVFGVGFPSLVQTIAHDVRFALDLPPSLAMERFYGEEASTNPEDVQPINYYANTSQLFLQDLKIKGGRVVSSDPVTLTIEFTDADSGERMKQVYRTTVGGLVAGDTRNLDKGRALMAWTDLILARAMGGSPCGAPFSTWQDRVNTLGPDAEIGWLDGLTSPLCGAKPIEPIARAGVQYRVKVDSDQPIAEVGLTCPGWKGSERLSGSDTVASFTPSAGASCTLTLSGVVPMQTTVTVPSTGGDLRCMVRGGRMSCS